jgi:EamA domain-containing membrane protein RarD
MAQEGKYMQWLYLIAAILGTILPLCFFVPFLLANGLDMSAFFRQLFQNQVSSGFGIDVIISSIVLWLFVFSEGKRRGMKHLWAYVLCNLLFGVSSALPLFLYFRERTLKSLSHSNAL